MIIAMGKKLQTRWPLYNARVLHVTRSSLKAQILKLLTMSGLKLLRADWNMLKISMLLMQCTISHAV